MQRLAALVPRPRLQLTTFMACWPPNARLRALVVPQGPVEGAKAAKPAECEAECAHHRLVRPSWARLPKRVFDFDLGHGPCPNCGGEPKIIAAVLEQPVHGGLVGRRGRAHDACPASGAGVAPPSVRCGAFSVQPVADQAPV